MAEIITLTNPVVTPTLSTYKISSLFFDWDSKIIAIVLKDNNNGTLRKGYSGSDALTLMNQLNTVNLSTTSLHKRIIQRLISDGLISGTISGNPD